MAEPIQTKRCSKCKQIKPLSEFSKNRTKLDGLNYQCKTCRNRWKKQYRQTQKGKVTESAYLKTAKGKVARKRYQQSEKGRQVRKRASKHYQQSEKGKVARERYQQNNPKQMKARSAVMIAVESGQLPHPDTLQCHYCPKRAKEYHHHKGYAPEHWLDVVPICVDCHYEARRTSI